ncbi:MAG: hypothetical protein KAG97_02605 [Victivallales bacterium]|nr:hypothetical protein [Victivallales bacterium]
MLKKSLLPISVCFSVLICSCATVKYTGPTYASTKQVAVFYGKTQIKKPYTVMGKATVSSWYAYQSESLIPALVEKAKDCGADAILIESINERIYASPVNCNDEDSSESIRSSVDPAEGVKTQERILPSDNSGGTESVDVSNIAAKFLKYKN